MSSISASSICIYIVGLVIGSLFGIFGGISFLLAIIFAVKYFKYSQNNSEADDTIVTA